MAAMRFQCSYFPDIPGVAPIDVISYQISKYDGIAAMADHCHIVTVVSSDCIPLLVSSICFFCRFYAPPERSRSRPLDCLRDVAFSSSLVMF